MVIIYHPRNPYLSERISDTSRQNFRDYLNRTGAKWYDMEHHFESDSFVDIYHLAEDGMLSFSPKMVDLIISEVKFGAVHYA